MTDKPLIAVRVEKGRLVPASEFDLELINNWSEGTILNVEATRTVVPPLERRYFAALSKLLKEADTPWSNVATAHEAIKLATGFVNYNKKFKPLARSISSFDSTELAEFYELFIGIVRARFGIDPDTLDKEASVSSDQPPPASVDDGPSVSPIPAGAGGPIPSHAIEPVEGGVPEGGGEVEHPRASPSPKGLSTDDLDWLRQTARMLLAAVGTDPDILMRQKNAIKLHHTHPDISSRARDIAAAIYHHCRDACHGEPLMLPWVAAMAGCEVADLKPEAR